jgi:pilus assembly protein CpaE
MSSFLSKLLGQFSGNGGTEGFKVSDQLIFDKVIGFRGVVPGNGTSTIVQNVAYALSERTNYDVCILDTAFLYPTQYPMLVSSSEGKRQDILDYTNELSDIVVKTDVSNVHLFSMSNRTIVDMLSNRDSKDLTENLIQSLKTKFDIILVDLSNEPTQIATYAAIKCNKVINIVAQSLKSVYHLRKSLNQMVSLAVPLAKANRAVINRVLPDVLSNTQSAVEDSGLTVVGQIPFSMDIAKLGVAGKQIYARKTSNKDIYAFSRVIDSLVEDIIQITPLNANLEKKDNDIDSSQELSTDEIIIVEDTSDLVDEEVYEMPVQEDKAKG